MLTAESMERKQKTGRDRRDCGGAEEGLGHIEVPCPLLDALGDEGSRGGCEEKDPCCFVGHGRTGSRGVCTVSLPGL